MILNAGFLMLVMQGSWKPGVIGMRVSDIASRKIMTASR